MNDINKEIDKKLKTLSDQSYMHFQQSLIPGMSTQRILGVRIPVLRHFAREFGKTCSASVFMSELPHYSYDADNLHAFLIEQIKDFDKCISALDTFLPYIDNWATCDMMSPKVLSQNKKALLNNIKLWLDSEYVYEVRFGIISLMRHFLDESFTDKVLTMVCDIKSDEYYINMARAWFFATALAKQWDCAILILKDDKLDDFTHNKTIQKAIESYRISKEQKTILRNLKRKKNLRK